jgi:hypothetical protein
MYERPGTVHVGRRLRSGGVTHFLVCRRRSSRTADLHIEKPTVKVTRVRYNIGRPAASTVKINQVVVFDTAELAPQDASWAAEVRGGTGRPRGRLAHEFGDWRLRAASLLLCAWA